MKKKILAIVLLVQSINLVGFGTGIVDKTKEARLFHWETKYERAKQDAGNRFTRLFSAKKRRQKRQAERFAHIRDRVQRQLLKNLNKNFVLDALAIQQEKNQEAQNAGFAGEGQSSVANAIAEIHSLDDIFGSLDEAIALFSSISNTLRTGNEETEVQADDLEQLVSFQEALQERLVNINDLDAIGEGPFPILKGKTSKGAVLSFQVISRLKMTLENLIERIERGKTGQYEAFCEVCQAFVRNLSFLKMSEPGFMNKFEARTGFSLLMLLDSDKGIQTAINGLTLNTHTPFALIATPRERVGFSRRFGGCPELGASARRLTPGATHVRSPAGIF